MRHILYVTGTRADYGLMRNLLYRINQHPKLELTIVATGMHLMKEFGETINEIKKDGFNVVKVESVFESNSKETVPLFISSFMKGLNDMVKRLKPDIILVLGDRAEMLVAAVVGAYLSIPVAQIHGGDVSSTVDNQVRHAITKLANVHFPATERSAKKIKEMGEPEWRIFLANSPAMDDLLKEKLLSKEEVCKELGLDKDKKIFLVLQHPLTVEVEQAERQMKETLEAVEGFDGQKVVLYPNADPGSRDMIKVIESYGNKKDFKIFKHLQRKTFLSLMKNSSVLIGNSSCGVIDTPVLKIPVINVGDREKERDRANNVIDVGYSKREIINAVKQTQNREFQEKLKECKSPYLGHKNDIVNVLATIRIDKKLLQKDN